MNATKTLMAIALAMVCGLAGARGGASSGGGHGGGGGGHSSSSGGSRGGFSSSSSSRPAPAPSFAPPPRSSNVQSQPPQAGRPVTTTTTTTTQQVNTSSRYVTPAGNYGAMGPGYAHNDGLLTGLLIGNMMHPTNTVVYTGGGSHNNNALLYPDGRVVNQQGQQVGTYQNGQFVETPNGPMVAQQIPQSALKPAEKETTVGEYFLGFMLVLAVVLLGIFLIGLLI